MHILIITPKPLKGSMFISALKRKNIKSITCMPNSLNYEWYPETDGVLIPHALDIQAWNLILRFLENLSPNIPIHHIGRPHVDLFEIEKMKVILPRIVQIDESIRLDQIPSIIKESIEHSFKNQNQTMLNIGGLKLDRSSRTVYIKDQSIFLTRKEFYLLELLMLNAGHVITREVIIENVWDRRTYVAQNTIDVYISRLRRKIDKHVNKTFIKTVPCLGYQFEKMGTLQSSLM